ncbi:MAG: hypothetical protein HY647_12750 [Acidobacteria bacterium]|nr:hypothetical protein [Acidobacteriota bacterium]
MGTLRLLTVKNAMSALDTLPSEINGLSPQREAAFFYGLFLRGHPIESLRSDIDVSPEVVARWEILCNKDPWYREALEIIVPFRKQVLAIFESLITSDLRQPRQQ